MNRRDFGCGDLYTIAVAGAASVHRFDRASDHPHKRMEHVYPSYSLVFTDLGEWQYHGSERRSMIGHDVVVTGVGEREYSCAHPRGLANHCFVIAIDDGAFEGDGKNIFASSAVNLTPEMSAHRRAIERALDCDDSEQIEGLAFSLYECVARASARATRIPPVDVRMKYAQKLLRDCSAERRSIAQVARDLNLSRFTFTRRFVRATGMAPQEFVMQLRVARAKEALKRTRDSVESIALTSGFGSIAHFSNAFRRVVGVSPTVYRLSVSSSADSNADG